jgi:metacaspase-1
MTPRGASWSAEYQRRPRYKKGTSGGLAVQFGSSRDQQVSADTAALSGTVSTGAATWAFINAIEKLGTSISYGRLLHEMSDTLHRAVGGGGGGGAPMPELPGLLGLLLGVGMVGLGGGGSGGGQNPVLSASQPFDLNSPLMLG